MTSGSDRDQPPTATAGEPNEWLPVFSVEEARPILRLVEEIADALRKIEPKESGLDGASGLALFFSYLGTATENERATEHATSMLDRALILSTQNPHLALFGGIAGVGWTVQHLASPDLDDPADPNIAVDRALIGALDVAQWTADYDLISGLAGFALYALARLPRRSAVTMLERIVEHLDALAERDGDRTTWHTPAEHLPPWQRKTAPSGYFNLGVAHGVPALIAVLARIVGADIAVERARPMLDGAVAWLLAQRLDNREARFGAWLSGNADERRPCRAAWCYGDPGVAMTLLCAGRAVGERAWEREAIELLCGAARRPAAQCGVLDVGLCHGAFGLATLFMRAFHVTHVPSLRDAAREWFERGLAMRRPELPIAGFPTHPNVSVPDPAFLTGVAGSALALLGAATTLEPAWHDVLLLNST